MFEWLERRLGYDVETRRKVVSSRLGFALRRLVGWLVDFGFNGPLRQYFSLYRAVSQREGERG